MEASVTKAMNEQINFEMSSAYLYLNMSLAMHEKNYKGYASWLFKQYMEELAHAAEFIEFMQKRDATVTLADIPVTPVSVSDPLEAANAVLAHERKVTQAIYQLHDTAKNANDYATEIFLHSFISEQIQEEDVAQDIIDKFTFASDSTGARMSVDRELGTR